jgi:seryl-tRNA synthetase
MAATLEELDRRVGALEAAQNDNTQTLRWVVAKLGKMEATLQEHTLRLERVEAKVDGIDRKLDGLIGALPSIIGDAVRAARQ